MNEPLTLGPALVGIFASGLVILITRIFSFIVFSDRNPPRIIRFIEKYSPALIMAILIVYCFKDVNFTSSPFGAPYVICTVLCAVLHLVFKNSMLSILGSTVCFMILSRIM